HPRSRQRSLQVVLLDRAAAHGRRHPVPDRPGRRVLRPGAATEVPRASGQQVTQTETAAPPQPVDWELADRVPRRLAGREPTAASYLGGSPHNDFSAVAAEG